MEICGKEIRLKGRAVRIAYLDGEGFQFFADPQAAFDALNKSEARIDLFTFIQELSDRSPKYSYPMEWDNMAVLPISTFDDWMNLQIDNKARNTTRKAAKKGVVIREGVLDEAFVKGISEIYNESPIRQGKRFPHYGKDLETLRRMKSTFLDRSIFIGAFFEGSLIGFAKLVIDERQNQAGVMHILCMIRHRDILSTNALLAQAVKSCAYRGIRYLWYGNFSYGKKQSDSLADFKRRCGFQRVELPRYYVPLTVVGRAALRLGLHHDINDWTPEWVGDAYRRIRSLWWAKRFTTIDHS
jgi:hypothetical protein